MSQHTFGLSGSTILSKPEKFLELFKNEQIDHIEIGEFPNEDAFVYFLEEYHKHEMTFGLHSPLYRNNSKYDLIEKVHYEPEEAWRQFEKEVEYMSEIGAEYILVHFPYFKEKGSNATNKIIKNGLKKLHKLREIYDIPIVCEPKLGNNRSGVGIEALNNFPIEIWEEYSIELCIDIGDYLMAAGSSSLKYLSKWKEYIKVVHLHNVKFEEDKYIWVPIHPSQERDDSYYNIQDLIIQLAESSEVIFVFEHTPHSNPSEAFVNEGIDWVKEIVSSR